MGSVGRALHGELEMAERNPSVGTIQAARDAFGESLVTIADPRQSLLHLYQGLEAQQGIEFADHHQLLWLVTCGD